FAATFAPEQSAFEIKVVGGQVTCRPGRNQLLLHTSQFGLQGVSNRLGNVALDCKNVGQLAIVNVSPEARVVQRVKQFHVAPHLVGPLLTTALKNTCTPKLLLNLS